MYTVLERTAFDFTTISAGQSRTIVLGRLCNVPPRTPARLAVRVHAVNFGASPTAAEIRLSPTIEIPGGQSWFKAAEPWLKIIVNAGQTAPALLLATQSRPLPPSLCAELVATYLGTLGGTATLSAELIV